MKGIKHNTNRNRYARIHYWLRKNFGRPRICEMEDCLGTSKQYDWALKKGKRHAKNRDNYLRLCHKCHIKYDMNEAKKKRLTKISHTKEANKKRSENRLGIERADWIREKISKGSKGKKISQESRLKLSKALKKYFKRTQVSRFSNDDIKKMRELKRKKFTNTEIAEQFGCSNSLVDYWTNKEYRERQLKKSRKKTLTNLTKEQ